MLKGKCLCGAIEFSAEAIDGMVFNCHCSRCRIAHGADYTTLVISDRNSLQFAKGKEHLKEYQSTGGVRCFCEVCGSRLMNYAKDSGDYLAIAAGCLDEDYSQGAVAHCFTDSKAPWHHIDDRIKSYPGLPDHFE